MKSHTGFLLVPVSVTLGNHKIQIYPISFLSGARCVKLNEDTCKPILSVTSR